MSDLFGNHIVGFSTRWLIYVCISRSDIGCFVLILGVKLEVFIPRRNEPRHEKTRFLHMQ